MSRKYILLVSSLLLVLVIAPYLMGSLVEDATFGGFLLNPIDGNSYLAKMQIGFSGEWKFTLPYTAHPGDGAYLFLFYIFLGHLSRIFGISVIIMFHIARIGCAAFLLWSIWKFVNFIFIERRQVIRRIFLLCVLGLGMGWLPFLFGQITSDFWVAEAFPFLSMYSSPHFSLGIALLLWAIMAGNSIHKIQPFLLAGLGLSISIVMPFGLVVSAVILAGETVIQWIYYRKFLPGKLIWLLLLGGPFLLYQYFATLSDPSLASWNAQNQTPSPPAWDFIVSFSPAIFLAGFGIIKIIKDKQIGAERIRVLVVWAISGILLIYFPFSLQRRFMFAYAIPCYFLAGIGLQYLVKSKHRNLAWFVTFAGSILTTAIVIFMGFFGVISRNHLLFLSKDEALALDWIKLNTKPNTVILCAPETGMFIPAYTGRRVIYGHPFETADAEKEKEIAMKFYETDYEEMPLLVLTEMDVDYVFYGPRELVISNSGSIPLCEIAFKSGDVTICSAGNR